MLEGENGIQQVSGFQVQYRAEDAHSSLYMMQAMCESGTIHKAKGSRNCD